MRVKSDGIIDWEKPNADFQRMVKLAHLVFSKRTKLIPQSAFIDGAKLFQQDDRVAVKTWDWSIQVHMSRAWPFLLPILAANLTVKKHRLFLGGSVRFQLLGLSILRGRVIVPVKRYLLFHNKTSRL